MAEARPESDFLSPSPNILKGRLEQDTEVLGILVLDSPEQASRLRLTEGPLIRPLTMSASDILGLLGQLTRQTSCGYKRSPYFKRSNTKLMVICH